jgi:hypothetical protein
MILLYGGSNTYQTQDILSDFCKAFKKKRTCQAFVANSCTDEMEPNKLLDNG